MTPFFALISFLAGLLLLFYSGNRIVDGSIALAKHFKVSKLFIGIAIIGFGTSLPEMMSAISAARIDKTTLLLGNVIGSNIANVALVLAIGLIISKHFKPEKGQWREFLIMNISMAIFILIFIISGSIGFVSGIILLMILGVYLALSLYFGRHSFEVDEAIAIEHEISCLDTNISINKALIFVALGLTGLFIGAELLIQGAIVIATILEISERIIGLTIVAIGTSLPELAAAIAAARKGSPGLILGNILGSNVFNILGATGIAAIITPLMVKPEIYIDLTIMVIISLMAGLLFIIKQSHVKILGFAILTLYAGYIIYIAAS